MPDPISPQRPSGLRLAINGVDLGRGRGGNESYLLGLISGLEVEPRASHLDVLVSQHYTPPLSSPATYVQTGPYRRLPYLLWTQSLALRNLHTDWFLSTFFLPALAPRHSALFVHDLSFLTIPDSYPTSIRLYMRYLVAWAVRRARLVLALSEFVRSEIRAAYPKLPNERLAVLYPGCTSDFTATPSSTDAETSQRYGLNEPYILSVCNIHPRKNLRALLEAYAMLKHQLGEACPRLVMVGNQYWGSQTVSALAECSGTRLLGYVPQADLPAIYRQALLFVYPSLYEGFGLPPVEAMASGLPVLCGNNSALPEATGDAALLVDMRSVPAIYAGIEHLASDKALRSALRERGIERAKLFRWRNTARQLMDLLQLCC
jgi:glycosyltransferase involved in cell wall biosynthesis